MKLYTMQLPIQIMSISPLTCGITLHLFLNELIDFFSRSAVNEASIEDYFIQNEIEIGNIEFNGFLLTELLDVDCSIDFIS